MQRKRKAETESCLLLQKYCRGYLVTKRYIKQRGDISIMSSLRELREMKHQMGTHLSNLLRFVWRCYWKKKLKKKKKKKGKGKGKKKKVDANLSQTMQIPKRTGSLVAK